MFDGSPVSAAPFAQPPATWIPRQQVDTESWSDPRRAHLVIGPRQAGKSSLVWSVLHALRRPLYINLEERALHGLCGSSAQFLEDIGALGAAPDALFLEEAQWLEGAGVFVKGLIDHRVPFPVIVTGSASFHLLDRMRESLAGRVTRHVLLPFSLAEVTPEVAGAGDAVHAENRQRTWGLMQVRGGYPEPWLAPDPALPLGDLLHACILRDASDLFRIERPDVLERLLRLCAHQVGQLVNQAEWASICGISASTVARYLDMMEQTHVLRLVPPFAGGKRRELTATRKVFFVDIGLRNALLDRWQAPTPGSPDRGAVYEGLIFTELLKALPWRRTIRFWRSTSGAEVDFVIEHPRGLLAIEVKAARLRRPKLSRAARSFIEAYQPIELWLLNDALTAEEVIGPTRVKWRPVWQLPELIEPWV